jgi:FIST C domain
MSRDNSLMLDSVRDGVASINQRLEGRETLFGLYVDCAGRASARSGASIEEAELVRRGLDPRIELLGFYSGVEIAPFAGYSRPLDWTGLLTVLRRRT